MQSLHFPHSLTSRPVCTAPHPSHMSHTRDSRARARPARTADAKRTLGVATFTPTLVTRALPFDPRLCSARRIPTATPNVRVDDGYYVLCVGRGLGLLTSITKNLTQLAVLGPASASCGGAEYRWVIRADGRALIRSETKSGCVRC